MAAFRMKSFQVSLIFIFLIKSISCQDISSQAVGKRCVFVTGYALGGADKYIGSTDSAQECLDLIKNIEKEANGMTWESQTKKCYAEFDPTHIDSNCKICQSCIFEGDYVSTIPFTASAKRYAKISSGSCETLSMTHVRDKAECEQSATLLGLQDTTAYAPSAISGRPYGCIYANNDWLGWYSPDGSPYPSVDCGTKQGDYTYACICRLSDANESNNVINVPAPLVEGPRTIINLIKNEKTDEARETRRGGENRNTRFKGAIYANLNGEGVDTQNIRHRRKKTDLYSSEANLDSLEADPSYL